MQRNSRYDHLFHYITNAYQWQKIITFCNLTGNDGQLSSKHQKRHEILAHYFMCLPFPLLFVVLQIIKRMLFDLNLANFRHIFVIPRKINACDTFLFLFYTSRQEKRKIAAHVFAILCESNTSKHLYLEKRFTTYSQVQSRKVANEIKNNNEVQENIQIMNSTRTPFP